MQTPRALLLLKGGDDVAWKASVKRLERCGGHAVHVIPPGAIIADVPLSAEGAVCADPNIASFHRRAVARPEVRGFRAQDEADAWNSLLEPRPEVQEPSGSPLVRDALAEPTRAHRSGSSGPQPSPALYQTSEFLVGSVAVGVILPESEGGTEDWSEDRQSAVFSKIVEGLDWWARTGGARANLTFVYEKRFSVPTQYEPIQQMGQNDQDAWASDIFLNMGYGSGTFLDRARAFDNDLRRKFNTDWAFSIIVADSRMDADHRFTDGFFAWSYCEGPMMVMTYDNDGWGIARMSLIAAHEMGHIFGAGDEYCQPGYACCGFGPYGYLGVENANCGAGEICMMNGCDWRLCPVSSDQVGWRDSDGDGRPDVVDNVVENSLGEGRIVRAGGMEARGVRFSGMARDIPCESPHWAEVTINGIASVRYRADGEAWQDAAPADGRFDSSAEGYTLLAPPGTRTIETQAFSSSRNASAVMAGQTIIYGDMDGDGEVTLADVTALMAHIGGTRSAGNATLSDVAPYPSADARGFGDGKLDLRDAIRLLRFLNGMDPAPPWN